jgi:hypothetical protein
MYPKFAVTSNQYKTPLVNSINSLTVKPIRNSQFAIMFCNGDLTPTQNALPFLGRGLKPPKFVEEEAFGILSS